jgi:hypothetical protein
MNSKRKNKRRAMEIIDIEPIKGCKNPFIASGATPIGSGGALVAHPMIVEEMKSSTSFII